MIITLCIFPLCFHVLCIQLCQPHLTIRVRFVNTFTWRVGIVDAANGRPSNRTLNQISTSKPACMLHLHPEPAAQDGCSWHLCRSTFHNKSKLVLMYSISIVIRCLQACVLMGSVRCKNPGPSQERPFQEEHTLGRGYKKTTCRAEWSTTPLGLPSSLRNETRNIKRQCSSSIHTG